jgi:hypothetical protein
MIISNTEDKVTVRIRIRICQTQDVVQERRVVVVVLFLEVEPLGLTLPQQRIEVHDA